MVWASAVPLPVRVSAEAASLRGGRGLYGVDSEVTARVIAVNVALGQVVERGTLMVQLEDGHLRDEAAVANERVVLLGERAGAQAKAAGADLRALEAGLAELEALRQRAAGAATAAEMTAAFAASRFAQARVRREAGLISEDERLRLEAENAEAQAAAELARLDVPAAEAALEAARSRRTQAESEHEAESSRAREELLVARETVEHVAEQLEQHAIRAPIGGRIVELLVPRPGAVLAAGQRVVEIAAPEPQRVLAQLTPDVGARVVPGMPAVVRAMGPRAGASVGAVRARVEAVGNSADSPRGHATVWLELDQPFEAAEQAPVRVEIEVARRSLLGVFLDSVRY